MELRRISADLFAGVPPNTCLLRHPLPRSPGQYIYSREISSLSIDAQYFSNINFPNIIYIYSDYKRTWIIKKTRPIGLNSYIESWFPLRLKWSFYNYWGDQIYNSQSIWGFIKYRPEHWIKGGLNIIFCSTPFFFQLNPWRVSFPGEVLVIYRTRWVE